MIKICKIDGCNKKYSARGYCHTHYEAFITRGGYKYHKCLAHSCEKMVQAKNKYCGLHLSHLNRGLPLDNKKYSPKGKRNVNWKGGIFEYPNHYQMKKNRLVILMNNPKCELCGNRATEVHHKDKSRTNHSLNNLQAVCSFCHQKVIHKNHNSKFVKAYGLSSKDIAQRTGFDPLKISRLHKENKLKNLLTFLGVVV